MLKGFVPGVCWHREDGKALSFVHDPRTALLP